MKKILCFILILMFTIIPVADAEGFIDVDSSYSWAVDAITELSNMGIINGYPDGTFKPENNIKNAETAKITVLVFGKSENEITYKDVLEDKWYYSYVKDSGNYFLRDESFMPDAGTLRKEIAYALYTGAGFSKLDSEYNEALSDSEKYSVAVSYLNKIGILKGYSDGTLGEEKEVTRAEFATLIKRVNDELKKEDEGVENENTNVSGYPRPHTFFYVVTDVMTALSEQGEPTQKICGYINGEYEENFIYDDVEISNRLGVADKIEVNDILYIFKDYFGKIMYVTVLEDADFLKNVNSYYEFNIYTKYKYAFGKVEKIRNGNLIEIIENEAHEITEAYRVKEDAAVYILEDDEIKLSKLSKIRENYIKDKGDFIFSLAYDDEITDILIIR